MPRPECLRRELMSGPRLYSRHSPHEESARTESRASTPRYGTYPRGAATSSQSGSRRRRPRRAACGRRRPRPCRPGILRLRPHACAEEQQFVTRSERSTCITRQRSGIVDRRRGGGEAAQPARSRGAGLSPQLARNEPRSPCHPRTTRARPAWVHEAQAMQEQMRRHVLGRGAVCRCGRRHYVAAPAVPNRFHRRAAQGPSRQAEVAEEGI